MKDSKTEETCNSLLGTSVQPLSHRPCHGARFAGSQLEGSYLLSVAFSCSSSLFAQSNSDLRVYEAYQLPQKSSDLEVAQFTGLQHH